MVYEAAFSLLLFFLLVFGGLNLDSSDSGFARLCGGKVAPPLGVVTEEVVVLIVLFHFSNHHLAELRKMQINPKNEQD